MDEHNKDFNKVLENIKKNQTELNNTIIEIRNALEEINNILDNTEEQISELEDNTVKITHAKQKKIKKRIFLNEDF